MHTLADAAFLLRVSKAMLSEWCNRGLVTSAMLAEGNQQQRFISQQETQRVKDMMYPHGMPLGGARPLSRTDIGYIIAERIKTSWLPCLAEWGILQAGITPVGTLVINSMEEIEEAIARLGVSPEALKLCAQYSARHAEVVYKVKRLI